MPVHGLSPGFQERNPGDGLIPNLRLGIETRKESDRESKIPLRGGHSPSQSWIQSHRDDSKTGPVSQTAVRQD